MTCDTVLELPPEMLDLFRESFARVSDAYGIETHGGPKAIRSPLTDELLRNHLDGGPRIGAYCIDAEGLADQLIFDDDENRPELVRRLLTILDELGIEAYPETSKAKGFHVRTHWEPAPAADLRRIGAFVAHRAGVPDIEVFPKQDRRGDPDPVTGVPGLGNFVWLPLHGESLKSGKTAILNSANGLDAFPDQWEALRNIRRNSHETLANVLAIVEEVEPASKKEKAPLVGDVIPELVRNDTLTSLGGTMQRRGMSPQSIEAALLAENQAKCTPPLHEAEVRKIVASVSRYPPAAPIAINAATPTTEKKTLFNDVGKALRAGIRPPVWLVKELIMRGFALLFGPSGGGKSMAAIYLSFCLILGRNFFGRKVESGPVIYITGEGTSGVYLRFAALELHYGVQIPEGLLFVSSCAVPLDSSAVPRVTGEIQTAMAVAGRPPVLIVVDTLACSIVGNENAPEDMGQLIAAVGAFAAEFSCTVLVVHHTGHSEDSQKRPRGHSSLPGALDTSIICRDLTLTWEKAKDFEKPKPIPFAIKKILLGLDEDCKPFDAAIIIEPEEGAASRTGHVRLTRYQRLALDTLVKLSPKGELRAGRYWVGVDEWRKEFVRFHCGDKKKSKDSAHRNIRGKLVDLGLVSVENDWYAVIRPEDIARVQDLVTIGPLLEKAATVATSESGLATS